MEKRQWCVAQRGKSTIHVFANPGRLRVMGWNIRSEHREKTAANREELKLAAMIHAKAGRDKPKPQRDGRAQSSVR